MTQLVTVKDWSSEPVAAKYVVMVSGTAQGKGVLATDDIEEAVTTIRAMLRAAAERAS